MELCLSQNSCLNPIQNLRPTRLVLEGSESQSTGYCSYCRRAGLHKVGAPAATPTRPRGVFMELTVDAGSPEMGRPVETEGDLSDYDAFDPDAELVIPDIPGSRGGANQTGYSPPVTGEGKVPSTPFLTETAVPTEAPSGTNEVDGAPGRAPEKVAAEQKPRKRGRPPVKAATPEPTAAPKEEKKVESGNGDDRSPFPTTETPKPSPFSRFASPGREETASTEGDRGRTGEEPPTTDAGSVRSLAGLVPNVLQTALTRPVPLPRPSAPVRTADNGGTGEAALRKGMVRARGLSGLGGKLLRATWTGLSETALGVVDLAGAAFRMAGGYLLLLAGLFSATVSIPATALLRPLRLPVVLTRQFRFIYRALQFGTIPFRDGRALPSLGLLLGGGAAAIPPSAIGYTGAVAMASLGAATILAWPIYRGASGLVTGVRLPERRGKSTSPFARMARGIGRRLGIRRAPTVVLEEAYKNPRWVNTRGMEGNAVHRLNNEFEEVTAHAMKVMGFSVTLNGTQNARANGHVGSGDGGVDVYARDAQGGTLVISCKRYSQPVGVQEVRDAYAVATSKRNKGSRAMIVTTVGYTEPARVFASENGVILTTLDDLIRETRRYAI